MTPAVFLAGCTALILAAIATSTRSCPYCHNLAWQGDEPRPAGSLDEHGCCLRCGSYWIGRVR